MLGATRWHGVGRELRWFMETFVFIVKIDSSYLKGLLCTLCWQAMALSEFVNKVQWEMFMPKLIGESNHGLLSKKMLRVRGCRWSWYAFKEI